MGIALETFFEIFPELAHKIIWEQHLFDALHIVLQSLAETEIYIHLPTQCELGQTKKNSWQVRTVLLYEDLQPNEEWSSRVEDMPQPQLPCTVDAA